MAFMQPAMSRVASGARSVGVARGARCRASSSSVFFVVFVAIASTTPLNSTEPSGCFVRIKSMNKTFTPELSPEVLERLRVYAAPFQAELRHQAQRSWSGVYLRGLL